MGGDQLGGFVVQALALGSWLALPALAACVIAAVLSAALQALTGIADGALVFVPKLLAVGLALFLSGAWMMERMTAFTLELWRVLP